MFVNTKLSEAMKRAYKEGRKEKFNPVPKKECPDVAKLKRLYEVEKMGSWAIGREFGVVQSLALRWLRDAGIEIRTLAEASAITRNGFRDGQEHPHWVGDRVSYSSLHAWVRQHKGTPQKCEICGQTKSRKYEWANKDHSYRRNLDDWIRLCTKCHRQYDKDNNNTGR